MTRVSGIKFIIMIGLTAVFVFFLLNRDLPLDLIICNDTKKEIQKIEFIQNGKSIFVYDKEIFQNEMIVVNLKNLKEEQDFLVKSYFKDGSVVDFVPDVYLHHGDQYSIVLKQSGNEVYSGKKGIKIL